MTIWQGHTDTRRCRLESEVQLPSYTVFLTRLLGKEMMLQP